MSEVRPARIRVRMYQVGFGDCFLLSFEYPSSLPGKRKERHVLIDLGSTSLAKGADLDDVAGFVKDHSGGRLDAIVLSHRHRDHMSGFGSDSAARVIDDLDPALVVRPWTEDPKAARDATSLRGRFVRSLANAQAFAAELAEHVGVGARGFLGEVRELALQQLANEGAIRRLDAWAKAADAEYLSIGDRTKLAKLLPGVDVSVLGPPTIDDWPDLTGAPRTKDPEYWMLLSRALASGALSLADAPEMESEEQAEITPAAAALGEPGPVRWLIERMRRQRLFLVQRIVRSLDDALNNTSLILLFEVGARRLLFVGDAQIENWEYVLHHYPKRQPLLAKLARLDLYKVGHHGSRNATPKDSLFARWSAGEDGHRMTSIVSTKPGVHGKTEATKVPRATLLAALRRLGPLYSTQELATGQRYLELVADVKGKGGFRRVSPTS